MWGSTGRLPIAGRALVGALAAATLAACAAPVEGWTPDPLASLGGDEPRPLRVLFFGSSTTAGSGASRPERRWTSILSRRLGWIEVNHGLSSSTLTAVRGETPSAEERWRDVVRGEPPDLVFVMYGANDVLARVPLGDPGTPGTFRHAAAVVVGGLRELLPAATVVVCTPQPARATAPGREVYDLALAEAAARLGAVFVAAGSAFPEERLGTLAADRLHPNDAGHAAIAEFFLARQGRFTRAPLGPAP